MTVASEVSRVTYSGDGVSTVFPIPFYFIANEDILVYLMDVATGVPATLTEGADYLVFGAGVPSGGNLSAIAAPAVGKQLAIIRNPVRTQLTDYTENDKFPAESHESALDRLMMGLQRLWDRFNSTLHISDAENFTSNDIPNAVTRAGKILAFDGAGQPTVTGGTNTLIDVATSAGSSFVGWIQAGIDAVVRTVQEKLRERVSVFDFMTAAEIAAVRGGISTVDVSAAIQAAINSLPVASGISGRGGYELIFPPGLYYITETLLIENRWLSLVGSGAQQGPNGTTIRVGDANKDAILATTNIVDGFSMRDMVVYGQGKGSGTGRGLVLGVNADASRICFSSIIKDCWFTGIPTISIDLQNTSDVRIVGGAVENCEIGVNIDVSTYTGGQVAAYIDPETTIFACTIGVKVVGGIGSEINGKFWFCGTSPGGAVDLVSGAVVIDHNGANAVRATRIQGKFIANVNDILIFGHNGNNASNTGVNDTSIFGTHHYSPFGRVLYNDGANDTVFLPAKIDRPCQQANNTYDVITNTGTSDGFVAISRSCPVTAVLPRYGLNVGATTTNNTLNCHFDNAGTAKYNVNAAAGLRAHYMNGFMAELAQKYTGIFQQDPTHRAFIGVVGGIAYVGSLDNMLVSLQVNNAQVGYLGADGLNQCDIGQSAAAKGKFTEIKYGGSNAIGILTVTNYMDWKLADGTAVKVALVS